MLVVLASALLASSASAAGCFSSPSSCGFPDATNSGPTGALTASGSITASTNGQVIENKNINGTVSVNADNVTIRNSRLTTTDTGSSGVIILANGADNFTLENSDVGGNGSTTNAVESGVWNHYNNPGARVINSYIHGTPDNWEGRVDLVEDSYMVVDASQPGSHDENIYVWCSKVHVNHSTLINRHQQTATVFGDNTGSGGCGGNDYTITNSLLAGGGFTLYAQSGEAGADLSNAQTTVTGNRFARCLGTKVFDSGSGGTECQGGADANGAFPQGGYFGLASGMNGSTTWKDNVWDDTSQPVCSSGAAGCGTATTPPPPADTPAAAVWTAPTGVVAGTAVSLNGSSSTGDAPIACTWSFENQAGTTVLDTRTGCKVNYTFASAGAQYVRLTVTDTDGDTNSSRKTITVAAAGTTPPPADTPAKAVWTAPTGVVAGVPVTLNGSASTGGTPLDCTWSFENAAGDIVWEERTGCVIKFTFEQADTKYVTLMVEDGDGDTNENRKSFAVSAASTPPADKPAVAIWTAPTRVVAGVPVTLDGSSSTGNAPIACTWSFENQAGSSISTARTGCKISNTFTTAGTKYVRLTVKDSDGDENASRKSFTVSAAPSTDPVPPPSPPASGGGQSSAPVEAIWSAPANVRQGQQVTLDGSGSTGARPLACVWTIDPGPQSDAVKKTGCKVGYKFRQVGTTSVLLTVQDNSGASDSLKRRVKVIAPRAKLRAAKNRLPLPQSLVW